MGLSRPRRRFSAALLLVISVLAIALNAQPPKPLVITSPTSYRSMSGEPLQIQLTAAGGTAPYYWNLPEKELPEGLKLDSRTGLITGTPKVTGQFRVPVSVMDASRPTQETREILDLFFYGALEVNWKSPASAREGAGIYGSVVVTNHTSRTLNLTVIVLAVNEINKAFALGYQHFDCKPNADTPVIPFGSTLPFGSYVVHVDAIAEDAPRNRIFRARLQTPNRLVLQQP